jgi:hypothetical protein
VGLGEAAVEHGAAGERRSRVLALGIPIDGAEPRGLGGWCAPPVRRNAAWRMTDRHDGDEIEMFSAKGSAVFQYVLW